MKYYSAFGLYKTIRAHLLKQMERCSDLGTCLYRDGDGLSCAIGCLVDDRHYEQYIRHYDEEEISAPVTEIPDDELGFNASEHENLAWGMQRVHDTIDPSYWHALKYLQWQDIARAAAETDRSALKDLIYNTDYYGGKE